LTLCPLVLLVFAGVARSAAAAELQGPVLEITVQSARLSVDVRQVRLADVLEAIGRQAGVRIVLHGDLDTLVTEGFVDEPLDEGLRRLIRGRSAVLIYDTALPGADGSVLTEIWVTSSSQAPAPTGQVVRGTPRNDARADARPPAEPEGWVRDLIAFKDANPETRNQMIEAMVRDRGEYAVVAALRDVATRDSAPGVRRAAIQVLGLMKSPHAGDAVRAALGDPHPGVRSEANTVLKRQTRARLGEGSVD
jgi:hypothetical protein